MLQEKYYDNGAIKEELYIIGDTIFGKVYSPNGKIKDFIRTYNINPEDSFLNGHNIGYYDNGKKEFDFLWEKGKANGIRKNYYPNGKIGSTGNFLKGLKTGIWYYYYSDGNTKEVMNFKDDIPVGMHFNYNDENIIKKISFRNHEGEIIYSREYSDIGTIINERGFPMSASFNSNILKKEDTLELFYRIGWLADWGISVLVKEMEPSKGKPIMQFTDSNMLTNEGWGKYFETYHVFKNAGSYVWKTEVKIFDGKFNREMRFVDTFKFVIK